MFSKILIHISQNHIHIIISKRDGTCLGSSKQQKNGEFQNIKHQSNLLQIFYCYKIISKCS